MIEERIKLLEERENLYKLDIEQAEMSKKDKGDEFLNEQEEENLIRIREINMKIRKEVEKKATKFDDNLLIDKDIVHLLDKQSNHVKTNINNQNMNHNSNHLETKSSNSVLNIIKDHQKNNDLKKPETNFMNNNKFRNSVLQIKMNKTNNISIFNNAYNKDVMNEFGNKFSFAVASDENKNEGNLQSQQESSKPSIINVNHKPTNNNQNITSLNKFFSHRNVDLTRPSPNKVFFFGVKK